MELEKHSDVSSFTNEWDFKENFNMQYQIFSLFAVFGKTHVGLWRLILYFLFACSLLKYWFIVICFPFSCDFCVFFSFFFRIR